MRYIINTLPYCKGINGIIKIYTPCRISMVALENIFFALSIVLFVVTSGYILYTCTHKEMFAGKPPSPAPSPSPELTLASSPAPETERDRQGGKPSPAPSPAKTPAPASSPIFVTSAIASSPSLPVGGNVYQLVTSSPAPAPSSIYQPVNPPYQQAGDTQPTLSTSQGSSRAGGLQTGFVEKTLPVTASENAVATTTKATPSEGKITSTPAPLEEKPSPAPKIESTSEALAKNNDCVQQYLGSCMTKEKILETTSFVILETDTKDQIYFGIPKELASFYTTGIELTRKEYSTSVKNKMIPFPYTITKVTVPVGYSVFFKTTDAKTDAISVSNSADGGNENILKTPVLVDPSKYTSISMVIIPM